MRRFLVWPGAPMALASAALFGASTPLAKLLLGEGVGPWLLAGLLYLGSGTGLMLVQLARRGFGLPAAEPPLRRADLPWLILVVLAGGARRQSRGRSCVVWSDGSRFSRLRSGSWLR